MPTTEQLLEAAIELLNDSNRLMWAWNEMQGQYGYYLRMHGTSPGGLWAGPTIRDAIELVAQRRQSSEREED